MTIREMKFLTAQPKGQTLVIILLGTSVALTVALAVSVRTISTLKQTTTSAQSQEALAAAEAGVEVALNYLKTTNCILGTELNCFTPTDVALPNGTFYNFVTKRTGGGTDPYLMDLAKDQTQEVKLDTYSGSSVQVCWWDSSLDGAEAANAVELIYVEGTNTLKKFAYNGGVSSSNGFSSASNHNVVITFPSNNKQITFKNCQNILPSGSMSSPKILRIKAFYSNFSAVVAPSGGATLPPQGYVVNSTGRSADSSVKKAIRVSKSLPALPAIFDFGLYNGSTTQPLSK